ATSGRRMAAIWGVSPTTPPGDQWPIIEFVSDGTAGHFQGWTNTTIGGWVSIGLPTGFITDSWHTLKIKALSTGEFEYIVDGQLLYTTTDFSPSNATNSFTGVMLQGYNYNNSLPYTDPNNSGSSYDIYWDNLT